jgi:hypothetical protein
MPERTIFLKKRPLRQEANAAGAIIPGQTIKVGTTGTVTAGPVAAAAPSNAPLCVAFEKELWNATNVDTPYATGDRVLYGILDPGAEWYALVAPSAVAIVIGDPLEYNGGYLRKATTGTVKAEAVTAVDNSGNAVSGARFIARAV